jgi:hypothetical protein
VEDFVNQVRDYFEILEGVEGAVAGDGRNALVWRVISAKTNSPIEIEAQAFAKDFAVNIDQRAEIVLRQACLGLVQLERTGERPEYFSDFVLQRAERFFERVTNGLAATVVDHGEDLPRISLTPTIARQAAERTRKILDPELRPYEELGSIEGFAESIERDGWGKPIFRLRSRLTGESIKVFVTPEAAADLERHQIREVWKGCRVQIMGRLHYRGLGVLGHVDAVTVRFLRDRTELPDVDDIQDENFTGGLSSEDFLARLRDGKPS